MAPDLADIHLKPVVLARLGLPDLAYPVPMQEPHTVLGDGGGLPLAMLLHGLQQKARDGKAPWRALEPAMNRLGELAAPDDDREVVVARGDDWWLEIGPVDLGGRDSPQRRLDAHDGFAVIGRIAIFQLQLLDLIHHPCATVIRHQRRHPCALTT